MLDCSVTMAWLFEDESSGYADAVLHEDIKTLEEVNRRIVKYSDWQKWADGMQEQALKCRHTPKLVAVTPPPSDELASVLGIMIKEGHHGSSGDSPKHPGDQVVAQ